jgi:hypothetical protein
MARAQLSLNSNRTLAARFILALPKVAALTLVRLGERKRERESEREK